MIDGFYSVVFEAPLGMGGGVLVLEGGILRGGDSTVYYTGNYTDEGGAMAASLRIGTHLNLPGHTSVFGIPEADLKVTGDTSVGGEISGSATSPQAPGITMTFRMKKIED